MHTHHLLTVFVKAVRITGTRRFGSPPSVAGSDRHNRDDHRTGSGAVIEPLRDDPRDFSAVSPSPSLDRLARLVADLMKIIEMVRAKGASLKILATGMETDNATGKLMIGVMAAVAEFRESDQDRMSARGDREDRY